MSSINLTKKELAELAGYTYRRLYDIDAGLPQDQKFFVKSETEKNKYSLSMFIQRWVAYNVGQEAHTDVSLEDARTIHEQVKTEKTQLEVARLRGELVDREEMHRVWATALNALVQNLLRLPSKISQQIFMLDNMDLVVGIIDKEIRDVLTSFSKEPLPEETEAEQEGTEKDGEE